MITAQGDLDPFMTPEPMGTETLRHLSKVTQLCHAPPPLCPGQAVPSVWGGAFFSFCGPKLQVPAPFCILSHPAGLTLTFELVVGGMLDAKGSILH